MILFCVKATSFAVSFLYYERKRTLNINWDPFPALRNWFATTLFCLNKKRRRKSWKHETSHLLSFLNRRRVTVLQTYFLLWDDYNLSKPFFFPYSATFSDSEGCFSSHEKNNEIRMTLKYSRTSRGHDRTDSTLNDCDHSSHASNYCTKLSSWFVGDNKISQDLLSAIDLLAF